MVTYIFTGIGFVALVLFLIFRDKFSSTKAVIWKSITSALFMATALAAIAENDGISPNILPATMVVMGLVLGLIGDITLDFKVYFKGLADKFENAEKDHDNMMYIGMIAFGIGHILYISATALRFPDLAMNLLWSAIGAVCFTAIVFAVSIKLLKMQFGKFLIPCVCYSVLLCWFVGLSASYVAAGATTASIILLVSSILFFVSDMVLSMTYFSKKEDYEKQGALNPESRLMISVNHGTYYAAQFLIAISLLFI